MNQPTTTASAPLPRPGALRVGAAALFASLLVAIAIVPAPAPAGTRDLLTGFADRRYESETPSIREDALDRTARAGGEVVRLAVDWREIAPSNRTAAFVATNPLSPGYSWGPLDAAVRDATRHGFRVLLLVQEAPRWAEGKNRRKSAPPGTWKPDPGDLADFGTALARRYSGTFAGLPRVAYYLAWGEANLTTSLTPVWKGKNGKKPASPSHYRKMLNAFYEAVNDVNPTNRVVSAETAPYGADPGVLNMRPLTFWRTLLCVKDNKRLSPKRKCRKPKFDVLAHNPINTSGSPRRSAIHPDDVSTPDLHNLVDVLRAAERAGNVRPKGKRPVWATELWWETNPPDPYTKNPSPKVQAVWYTKSLYSLWRQGASMVLLLQVRDSPYDGEPGRFEGNYQSGVFEANGDPKPAAAAMRFPFVADRKSKRKVVLWGIPPRTGRLVVAEKGKSGAVSRFQVRANKVFRKKIKLRKRGRQQLRGTVAGERSRYWTVR